MEFVGWQPIVFEGRMAAPVSADEMIGASWLCALDDNHPVRRFVSAMCISGSAVLRGELCARYSDELAARFARTILIDDEDLLACWYAPDEWLAARYGVPVGQLVAKRADLSDPVPPAW